MTGAHDGLLNRNFGGLFKHRLRFGIGFGRHIDGLRFRRSLIIGFRFMLRLRIGKLNVIDEFGNIFRHGDWSGLRDGFRLYDRFRLHNRFRFRKRFRRIERSLFVRQGFGQFQNIVFCPGLFSRLN